MGCTSVPAYYAGIEPEAYKTPLSYWIARRLAEDPKLTMSALIAHTGVRRSTAYSWYSGSTARARSEQQWRICEYLQVPMEQVFPSVPDRAPPCPYPDPVEVHASDLETTRLMMFLGLAKRTGSGLVHNGS